MSSTVFWKTPPTFSSWTDFDHASNVPVTKTSEPALGLLEKEKVSDVN